MHVRTHADTFGRDGRRVRVHVHSTRTHTVHVLLGSHGGMDDLLSDLMDLRVFFRFRIHHDEHSRRSPCSRMALKHGFTRFSPPPTVKISRFPPSESKIFSKARPAGAPVGVPWRGKSRKNPNGAGKSEKGGEHFGRKIYLYTNWYSNVASKKM